MGRDKQPKSAAPTAPAPAPAPDAKKSRGHRQRGAGTVIKAPPPRVTADGIVLAPHMRMPSVLLQEFCQREKRERPIYREVPAFGENAGKYKFTLLLKDGKNAKKDLRFCPSEFVESEYAAKDFSALLALHYFQPTLPLERKIPEPFATTWINLCKSEGGKISAEDVPADKPPAANLAPSAAPAPSTEPVIPKKTSKPALKPILNLTSTTPVSTHDKEQAHLARRRARGISAHELANKPSNVYMSPKIRKMIETALGLSVSSAVPSVSAADLSLASIIADCIALLQNTDLPPYTSSALSDTVQILESYEFPLYNIHEALLTLCEDCVEDILSSEGQEDMVAYLVQSAMAILCLNVDESALPKFADPSKNNHRNTGISVVPKKDSGKANVSNDASKLMKFGWSADTSTAAIDIATLYAQQNNENLSLVTLASYFLHVACVSLATASTINTESLPSLLHHTDDIVVSEELAEELEMLEAIYADQCSHAVIDGSLVITVQLNRIGVPHTLTLSVPPTCNYPAEICSILLAGPAASEGVYVEIYRKAYEMSVQNMGYLFQLADCAEDIIGESVGDVDIIQTLYSLPFVPQTVGVLRTTPVAPPLSSNATKEKTASNRTNAFWTRQLEKCHAYTTNKDLLSFRNNLPAANLKYEFIDNIERHLVVILTGDTGSGKSTQMPQYIQEHNAATNNRGRIVVCQPRRLAAITVAERVSDEQGQSVGNQVGYSVRGQAKYSSDTTLLFCTYGILLRHLQNDALLSSVNYIMLDEVHERGAESDFTLALLIEAVAKRYLLCQTSPTASPLKLVMMSATIQTEKFAAYVHKQLSKLLPSSPPSATQAPIVSVAGRAFPVIDYYLDDFLDYLPKAGRNNKKTKDSKDVNYDAIAKLVGVLARSSTGGMLDRAVGAVLIFMPGVAEIQKLINMIQPDVPDALLLPLHGALSPKEQQRAFAPSSRLKIVVSTNIAEASVTIADVTVVIDCCRVKEMCNNNQISSLTLQVASKDSCRQRMGRAGRVSKGRCFRVVTREEYEALPQSTTPEILRTPLDRLLLMLHCLSTSDPVGLLLRCIDAPSSEAIDTSLRSLTALQALRQQESLVIAPLGRHLIHLPCDPTIGKMLIYGALLGVAAEAAAVAACLVSRDPFWSGPDESRRAAVRDAKARLVQCSGSKSDFIIYAELLHQYVTSTTGMSSKRSFCSANAVVYERMEDIAAIQEEFLGGLFDIGFITHRPNLRAAVSPATTSERKKRNNVVIAAVCAGLYPNVAKILRPSTKYDDTVAGAFEKSAEVRDLRFYVCADRFQAPPPPEGKNKNTCTKGLERVTLHPSSNLFGQAQYAYSFMIYAERVQSAHQVTSQISYVRSVAEVSPYALLLFGGELSADYIGGEVCIDNWIRFSSPGRIVALVNAIREALDALLTEKIATPSIDVEHGAVMTAVNVLLAYDGVLL